MKKVNLLGLLSVSLVTILLNTNVSAKDSLANDTSNTPNSSEINTTANSSNNYVVQDSTNQTITDSYDTTNSTSSEPQKTKDSLSDNEYTNEKENALRAGYTIDQFEKIMNMPTFPSEDISIQKRSESMLTADQSKVVNMAKAQLGKPYVWGAKGPNSFDCSGLVQYVFSNAVNMNVPAPTMTQEKLGKEVSLNSLLPGDLLFYGDRGNTYHVGIYIGNNKMIHAPQPGQNVTTVDIQYFYPSFARRILSEQPDYPYENYNKMTTVSKSWSIWSDLQFSKEIKKAIIGDNYKIGKVYTNTQNNTKYGEILVNNNVLGYINFDAVTELSATQINKYLTSKDSGKTFWGNLECTSDRGKTGRDKIYFVKGAYNLGNGKKLYSIYKDENSSEWLGYLKEDSSLVYSKTEALQKNITISKSWSIWNNLQWEKEIEKPMVGSVFSAQLKLFNESNNSYFYKIYKAGKFYGFINAAATEELRTQSVNKYVTFSKDNDNYWSSLEKNNIKGKTERGRVYYTTIKYLTANNQPIYSVYTDESASNWLGYYTDENFEDTEIKVFSNATFKIRKSGYTIWKDLNFKDKSGSTSTDQTYKVNREFYNFTNNAYYLELLKDGKIYGYVNSEAALKE